LIEEERRETQKEIYLTSRLPYSPCSHGGFTSIAATGHTFTQAIQNIQACSFTGSAFFSDTGCPGVSYHWNTLTGHAFIHEPSAIHTSKSTPTIVPCTPRTLGGFSGRYILYPACSPTTGLLVL